MRLRTLIADIKAVTAIEFALIAPVLLTILTAIFELGLSFLVEVLLDNAVAEASRKIRTGQVFYDSAYTQQSFRDEIIDAGGGILATVEDRIFVNVERFDDFGDIDDPEPLIDDEGQLNAPTEWEPGVQNNVIVVQAVCAWPMISGFIVDLFGVTNNGERLLVATQIFRNEPF